MSMLNYTEIVENAALCTVRDIIQVAKGSVAKGSVAKVSQKDLQLKPYCCKIRTLRNLALWGLSDFAKCFDTCISTNTGSLNIHQLSDHLK